MLPRGRVGIPVASIVCSVASRFNVQRSTLSHGLKWLTHILHCQTATMSWLKPMSAGETPAAYKEESDTPKIEDPSIPNRMVEDKPANRPFLA